MHDRFIFPFPWILAQGANAEDGSEPAVPAADAGTTAASTGSSNGEDAVTGFGSELMKQWGELGPILQTVVAVIAFSAIFMIFRRLILRRLVRAAARTENDLDDRLVHFMRRFYGLAMLFLIALWILRIWKIEISPLLAGAGILGISLGFAAKEFIADILAGIFLITDRPMAIGDRVNIDRIGSDWGRWGDVVDIGLRRTQIRTTDGVVVNYPNAILSNSVITNFSHEPEPVRVRVRFAVSLDADLAEVMKITSTAVKKANGVLGDTVEVVIRSIWDQNRGVLLAGALIEARYRIEDVRERTRIRSRVLEQIAAAVKKEGIPLPAAPFKMSPPGE